jgi:outer membrane receptor protein involved in Fe transport
MKSMRQIRIIVLLLLLALSLPAASQEQGAIAGIVTDAVTGRGLDGASMMIEESGLGVVTDVRGTFRLAPIPPGDYTLIVSFVGYRTRFERVRVESGRETRLDIRLQTAPIGLERTLIEADPAALSTAASRPLRAFDLRTRPHRSTRELLQVVPGLFTVAHGGGKAEQIFMRGFDSGFGTDVAVAVDGMSVNLVSHGHGQGYADLHFLIPEVVERMELFKGPYFAEFGNLSSAGQILFHTYQRLPENRFQVEKGAFGSARYVLQYQLPDTSRGNSAYFAGDFSRTDGPFDHPQDLHRLKLFAKVHRRLSGDATLTVDAGGVSSAWDASSLIPQRAVANGRVSRWGSFNDALGGNSARQNLNLTYRTRSPDAVREFTAHAYLSRYHLQLFSDYTFFYQDPIFGDMVEQTDSRLVSGLDSKYRTPNRFGPLRGTATLGGGFRADDIDLSLWQVVARRRYWPLSDARVHERNFFFWGQEELALGPRWRLILGLRTDYFTFQVEDRLEVPQGSVLPLSEWLKQVRARGKLLHVSLVQPHASGMADQMRVSPKLGLAYSPIPGIDLFANAGAGFHSNDARSVVVGQFVRDQWRAMESLGASPEEIVAVLDTLNFDSEQRRMEILPRTVGAEIGFRLRLLGRAEERLFGRAAPTLFRPFRQLGAAAGHAPGNARIHAPVAGLQGTLNLSAVLWWIDVDEEFIYTAETGVSEERGRTRRWGVDVETRLQLLSWLWADADLNWAHARLRDAEEDKDAVPLAPRFTAAGGLTARLGSRWEGSFRYRRIDDRPATADGSLTAGGYALFDLSLAHHAGDFRIDLAVENLFDTEWREAQYAIQSLLPGEGELALRGPGPPPEVHFASGNPRNLRIGISFFY